MGLVGLIPAAGQATRFSGLPKFALPTPTGTLLSDLVAKMLDAGATHVYIGTNEQNYSLVRNIAPFNTTIYTVKSATMSETVLCAWPLIGSDSVLFGMPDTHFNDPLAFHKLKNSLDNGASVTLGLWHTNPEQRSSLGMVSYIDDKAIGVVDKPQMTTLEYAWGLIGWNAIFWQYISPVEPHIGYALNPAILSDLDVRVELMQGVYTDCGNKENYFDFIRCNT